MIYQLVKYQKRLKTQQVEVVRLEIIPKEEPVADNQEKGGSSDLGGDSGQQSSDKSLNSGNVTNQTSEFTLKSGGVLTSKENINWDIVKSEIENLYLSIPTITIDLYNQNVNQDEILAFNKEFDNLTIVAKDEKKVETLTQLSKIYDYLPKFMQDEDELEKILVETKSNIFKAYSKLDNQNWTEISSDVKNAIDVYSRLLTNPNIDNNKQYSISKAYIMLNELQNAVNIKDTSVFLIKYKNLLEEINAMVTVL